MPNFYCLEKVQFLPSILNKWNSLDLVMIAESRNAISLLDLQLNTVKIFGELCTWLINQALFIGIIKPEAASNVKEWPLK